MSKDPRIDTYIAEAAPFAQPILTHVRALVHETLPGIEETLKWSMPHFVFKGKNIAGMAAFKAHASFTIHGEAAANQERERQEGMGHFGKLTSLADLPDGDLLKARILAAAERVETTGSALAKKPPVTRAPKPEIPIPDDFATALAVMQGVRERFDGMLPGARREYLEWIVGAKRAETRASRIAKACEQIAEGKKLNWKYENC